jgi:hypothetical protein
MIRDEMDSGTAPRLDRYRTTAERHYSKRMEELKKLQNERRKNEVAVGPGGCSLNTIWTPQLKLPPGKS